MTPHSADRRALRLIRTSAKIRRRRDYAALRAIKTSHLFGQGE